MSGLRAMPPARRHGLAQRRRDHLGEEVQLIAHTLVVGAVVEPPAGLAFVEIAKRKVPERPVLHHEHRHRGGVDARNRSDAAVVLAALDLDRAGGELALRVLDVGGEPFEERPVHDGVAGPAPVVLPRQAWPGGEDRVGRHARDHVAGGLDVDEDRLGPAHPVEGDEVGAVPVRRRLVHHAETPPSTRMTDPVTYEDRSERRNSTTSAISSTSPSLPSGT